MCLLDEFSKDTDDVFNLEDSFNSGIVNNNDDFSYQLPDANKVIEYFEYSNLEVFQKSRKTKIRKIFYETTENYLLQYIDVDKYLDIFVADNGRIFIKAKRDTNWSQITDPSKAKDAINRLFIDIDYLKIIRGNDGRSNQVKHQHLMNIIKDNDYRIEIKIDVNHPLN